MISSHLKAFFSHLIRLLFTILFPKNKDFSFLENKIIASLKTGKKIGQKLVIFQPNFCPIQACLNLTTNILWSNPANSSLFPCELRSHYTASLLCTQHALSGQYRCITLIYQVNLTPLNPLGFRKNKFCIFIMINKL